jgi:hypothetical protein
MNIAGWVGICLSLSLGVSACAPPDGGDNTTTESDNSDTKSVAQGTKDGWLYSDAIPRFMGKLGPWTVKQYDDEKSDTKCQYNIESKSTDYQGIDDTNDANLTKNGVDKYQLMDLSPFTTFHIQVQTLAVGGADGFRPVMCLNAAKPGVNFQQCGDVSTQKGTDGVNYYAEYDSVGKGTDFRKAGWVVVTTEDSYKAGKAVPIANGNGHYGVVIDAYRAAAGDCPTSPYDP